MLADRSDHLGRITSFAAHAINFGLHVKASLFLHQYGHNNTDTEFYFAQWAA